MFNMELVCLLVIASFCDVIIPRVDSGDVITRTRDSSLHNLLALNNEYGPEWGTDMLDRPTVYIQPTHASVRLRCDANGRPKPTVTWYKDGGRLLTRPFGQIEQRRYTLKLSDLMPADSGNYTCLVSNRHGQLSRTYVLEVLRRMLSSPPRITRHARNQTVNVGDNVTFHCSFRSEIEAYIHWFKLITSSQSPLDTDWHSFHTMQTEMDLDVSDPTKLVLSNVTSEDAGIYVCHVTNKFGDVTSNATLTVVEPTASSVLKEKLDVTAGHHVHVIIALALSTPLIITFVVIILLLVHRRRWKNWRKHSLAISTPKMALSTVPTNQFVTSHQSLQPPDACWELDTALIKEHELLGEGAFGEVYKATVRRLPNAKKQTVAIKKLKASASHDDIRAFVNELNIMKSVGRHVNVIALIGCCTKLGQGSNRTLLIAVEFARHGNLRDFLRRNRPVSVSVDESSQCQHESSLTRDSCHVSPHHLMSFAHQTARGMQFLASNKIIHRDLAARNVLVADKMIVKIADFGLTRQADCYKQRNDPQSRVPMKWMSPESLAYNIYNTSTDVWSYGVLLWEIFTYGQTPYPSVPAEFLCRRLQTGYRMEKPTLASQYVYDVMLHCWAGEQTDRPSFTDLIQLLDTLLINSVSVKYLQLEDSEVVGGQNDRGSSSTDSSSGSSWDTQSSTVSSSDDRSTGRPAHQQHHHHQPAAAAASDLQTD